MMSECNGSFRGTFQGTTFRRGDHHPLRQLCHTSFKISPKSSWWPIEAPDRRTADYLRFARAAMADLKMAPASAECASRVESPKIEVQGGPGGAGASRSQWCWPGHEPPHAPLWAQPLRRRSLSRSRRRARQLCPSPGKTRRSLAAPPK